MADPKILIVGGGGREHALAWKIARDSSRPAVFCAPGNAGTAQVAGNVPIQASDPDGLVAWARENRPDLTVIGPEAPLCAGLSDRLEAEGLRVFGPGRDGARLEGSKAFAKEIMASAGVPSARAARFTRAEEAMAYVRRQPGRLVVKADGLAAGKGVTVCDTAAEAAAAVEEALIRRAFGEAGLEVLVEERLEGEEVSVLALTDGKQIELLASAQDHKRVGDGDTGPNTGGMGAYSPAPVITGDMLDRIAREVIDPLLEG
ncbi:MAG: phosphoribosylamine--glycine ligase, partial [Verrucomicrobia bacterium]|nr:phosphoribosylamine--glycine ligase [Verrucomicrobiota bacterium]